MVRRLSTCVSLGAFASFLVLNSPLAAADSASAFTFQGRLVDDGVPVTGTCDFSLTLWDAESGGLQVVPSDLVDDVRVTNGLFSLQLDFGPEAFSGADRWLEVTVQCPSGIGASTLLSPRQPITAVPYAIHTRGINVSAEGNVGIGTSTPRNLLDVAGPAYFDSALALGTGTAGGYFSVLEDHPDKNSRVNIYAQGRSGAVELFDANGHTVAMDAASVSLYAAPDTDPDIQLHALGSSKIKARGIIESTYGGFMFPDGSIQTTANTTAEVSLPPWSGPDAQNNISFPGDVNIGGGAASFDDTAERLAIRAQTGEWRVGVKNTPAGADADFFIAMATTPPSTDAFTITPQGNVGIHNLNPPSRLTVGGVIESVSGGFKFPDGTTQITQPVTAINTLHGAIDITGGAGGILVGTSADTEGNHIVISAPLLPPPVGITSINQQHGPAIQLVQGDNVTITSPTSNQIKISATPVGSCTCPVGVEKIKVNSASDAGADGTVLLQAAGAAHLSRVGDTITISSPQPVSTFCVVTNNPQIAQPCTCGTATAIVSNQAGPGSITSDSGTCVGNFSTSRLCQCSP